MLGYSGSKASVPTELVLAAESLGYSSVWTAEAWGSDAVTPAAWILAKTNTIKAGTAIMQMSARTPAMTAMTAMTLNHLSEGRFIVGIGASGPPVVEGWYGEPYGKPIQRTKEYVSILKNIFLKMDKQRIYSIQDKLNLRMIIYTIDIKIKAYYLILVIKRKG